MKRWKIILIFSIVSFLIEKDGSALAQKKDPFLQQHKSDLTGGSFVQAESIINQVIKPNPDNAESYIRLGDELSQQNKREKAIAAYKLAIEKDSTHAEVYAKLGNLYYRNGQLNKALQSYQQASNREPNNPQYHYNLGNFFRILHQYKYAIKSYNIASSLVRANSQFDKIIKKALKNTKNELKRFNDTIAPFLKAYEQKPNDARSIYNLGKKYHSLKHYTEAEDSFILAFQLNPNFINAYIDLGEVLFDQDKLFEAEKYYLKALQVDPDSALAYAGLGRIRTVQNRLSEAEKYYLKALQVDPDSALAYAGLGRIRTVQNRLSEAEKFFSKALQIDPSLALAHAELGLVFKKQGKLQDASLSLDKALKLQPDMVIAKINSDEVKREITLQIKPKPKPPPIKCLRPNPIKCLMRSVVRTIAETSSGSKVGAGWVYKKDGNRLWIVTNRHVLIYNDANPSRLSQKIEVEFFSEPLVRHVRQRLAAKLIHSSDDNETMDMALLEVMDGPMDIQTLNLLPKFPGLDTDVRIIGHHNPDNPWSLSRGYISNGNMNPLQVSSATVGRNSSGSPVLDKENRVVGMMVEIAPPIDYVGSFSFAIPSSNILETFRKWGIR